MVSGSVPVRGLTNDCTGSTAPFLRGTIHSIDIVGLYIYHNIAPV